MRRAAEAQQDLRSADERFAALQQTKQRVEEARTAQRDEHKAARDEARAGLRRRSVFVPSSAFHICLVLPSPQAMLTADESSLWLRLLMHSGALSIR